MPEEKDLITGEAERVGVKSHGESFITHTTLGVKRTIKVDMPDHKSAFKALMKEIEKDVEQNKTLKIDAFAHRYVHPGNLFDKTTRMTSATLKKMKETFDLAPLHNPVSHSFMEMCLEYSKEIPQYAVFDTAFHAGIPKGNYTYALPMHLIKKYGLRRVGFHGISHKFVTAEACKFLKVEFELQKIISCHLGTGGASICAVKDGRSINNTMGLTPLEGLVMNTRSGDLDAGILFRLIHGENITVKQADETLNKKSGVLGIFGTSSDLRDAVKRLKEDKDAAFAFGMFIRRIKKYIGYYAFLLQKPDIVIFTDSLGTQVPLVREKVIEGLEIFGIALDKNKNNDYKSGIADISNESSSAKVLILPTNEEIMIAREAYGAHK
jgi:acetate kinase